MQFLRRGVHWRYPRAHARALLGQQAARDRWRDLCVPGGRPQVAEAFHTICSKKADAAARLRRLHFFALFFLLVNITRERFGMPTVHSKTRGPFIPDTHTHIHTQISPDTTHTARNTTPHFELSVAPHAPRSSPSYVLRVTLCYNNSLILFGNNMHMAQY
jgi:hypothetical protein